MPPLYYNLGYLQACVPEIEAYLLSKTLFWPVGGTTSAYPRLTLGGLLFTFYLTSSMKLSSQQTTALQKCEAIMNAARSRWQVAWERKSQREFLSRLKQWQNYINDLVKDPENQAPYYSNEVRLRAFISLLQPEMEQTEQAYFDLLDRLDLALRSNFILGEFIWDKEFVTGFPRDTFWYLWGIPGPA